MFRRRRVTIIRHPGTSSEKRIDAQGDVQPQMGFFPAQTDIDVGDVVEVPDPRVGRDVMRYSVGNVEIYSGSGPRSLDHIEVRWGAPPARPRPAPATITLGELHPQVVEAAGRLYADQHYAQAVFEAFKSVEARVRQITGIDQTGLALIGQAFGGKPPAWTLTQRIGRLGDDEHEGRTLMLMGAVRAVRNLGAHELEGMEQGSAIELLGLASQMMRWLDSALLVL